MNSDSRTPECGTLIASMCDHCWRMVRHMQDRSKEALDATMCHLDDVLYAARVDLVARLREGHRRDLVGLLQRVHAALRAQVPQLRSTQPGRATARGSCRTSRVLTASPAQMHSVFTAPALHPAVCTQFRRCGCCSPVPA